VAARTTGAPDGVAAGTTAARQEWPLAPPARLTTPWSRTRPRAP